MNEKYVVFKRADLDTWLTWLISEAFTVNEKVLSIFENAPLGEIEDAVVIRHQDIFAAPAFFEYAGQIGTFLEIAEAYRALYSVHRTVDLENLGTIRDYFHEQGLLAQKSFHKLPD